jgi:hypothetical protein
MMEKLRVGVWYFALVVSASLALITFYSGEGFLRIVINAILGFALIYGLCIASITLFEKKGVDIETHTPGALLDIAVGHEDELSYKDIPQQDQDIEPSDQEQPHPNEQNLSATAGQLNRDLAQGLPSAEKQAEIVRRMGWGD